MLESRPDEFSDKTNRLYEELNAKLNEYIQSVFEDTNDSEHGDYIDSWAVVLNYGNLNSNTMAGGYLVETFPNKMPPHALKGLLREGIKWVEDAQYEIEELDE